MTNEEKNNRSSLQESYVSFKTAELLKEKGFPQHVTPHTYFVGDDKKRGCIVGEFIGHPSAETDTHLIDAPTQSLAMRWLRDVHNICVYCYPSNLKKYGDWEAGACWIQENVCVIFNNDSHSIYADSYEQACEDTIAYCLTNLVQTLHPDMNYDELCEHYEKENEY